jgi:hypothetical protein
MRALKLALKIATMNHAIAVCFAVKQGTIFKSPVHNFRKSSGSGYIQR